MGGCFCGNVGEVDFVTVVSRGRESIATSSGVCGHAEYSLGAMWWGGTGHQERGNRIMRNKKGGQITPFNFDDSGARRSNKQRRSMKERRERVDVRMPEMTMGECDGISFSEWKEGKTQQQLYPKKIGSRAYIVSFGPKWRRGFKVDHGAQQSTACKW